MQRSCLHVLPFALVMNWTYGYIKDPCSSAVQLFEPNGRFRNCKYDSADKLCDRYIHKRWYRFSTNMLTQCPGLLSCGALYPIWLNGTLPTSTGSLVNRTTCKVGFGNCCVKEYDIQIKNCGTYMAYCLIPADGCPERYCFGENGTCEPTRTTDVYNKSLNKSTLETRNSVSISTTTILPSTSSFTEDPCKTALSDSRCHYELDNRCHEDLRRGSYSSSFPVLTTCPTKPICNSFYLDWINGSLPLQEDGIVIRNVCRASSLDSCCEKTYPMYIKLCQGYIAYYLDLVERCKMQHCFGYGGECKDYKQKNESEIGKILLITLPSTGVLAVIIIGAICYMKRKPLKEKGEAEAERQYEDIDDIQDNGSSTNTELSVSRENISRQQNENTGYESHMTEEEPHIYDEVTMSQPIQNINEQIS